MIVKKRIENGKIFLSICDKELIGKVFSEKNKILDLKSPFYKGEEIEKKEILSILKESYFITCIGEKSTKLLLELKYVEEDSVKIIKNIPYSMLVRDI